MTIRGDILQAAGERIRRLVGGLRPTKDDRRAVHLLAHAIEKAPDKDLKLPPLRKDRKPAAPTRSELRAQAIERDGNCVLRSGCVSRGAPHMHHVVGRHDERLETVAMLCWGHHDRHSPISVHAGHVPTLRALYAWCVEHDSADAARAVTRKLSKIEEAQRFTHSRKDP